MRVAVQWARVRGQLRAGVATPPPGLAPRQGRQRGGGQGHPAPAPLGQRTQHRGLGVLSPRREPGGTATSSGN